MVPVYASAQTPDRISILENFGTLEKGEPLIVFGKVANLDSDSFLIMQIINPQGDLCQIQQLTPLPNGAFVTDAIPLKGRICGVSGEYEIKLFYGDHTKSTTFSLSSGSYSETSHEQRIELAKELVSSHAQTISDTYEITSPVSDHASSSDLDVLETTYVDL